MAFGDSVLSRLSFSVQKIFPSQVQFVRLCPSPFPPLFGSRIASEIKIPPSFFFSPFSGAFPCSSDGASDALVTLNDCLAIRSHLATGMRVGSAPAVSPYVFLFWRSEVPDSAGPVILLAGRCRLICDSTKVTPASNKFSLPCFAMPFWAPRVT